MDGQAVDMLYRAALVWNELTEYNYLLTYGYKKQLYTINLVFELEDFPHLAGFQYLRDLSLPRYNPRKTVNRIIDHKITYEQISKGELFEDSVKPRLEALAQLKIIIEKDFSLFSYMPRMYPFATMIKADYLISSHLDTTNYLFVIKSSSDDTTKPNCLCCSVFTKGERDYECNQCIRTILKKERIHISTQESTILYDRLSSTAHSTANESDSSVCQIPGSLV